MVDVHFAWMLGEAVGPGGLTLPRGGVDHPEILRLLRGMTQRLHTAGSHGSWMIVDGTEVVGLCSYKQPPRGGMVEIGYGIAGSRRRRGHATRAVAAILTYARCDPAVNMVTASTSPDNLASQGALVRNGFVRSGKTSDPDDGELLLWCRELS